MTVGKWAVLIAAALVVFGRMLITPRLGTVPSIEGIYGSFAHLFVGFLILVRFYDPNERLARSRDLAVLGWFLAFYELVYFVAQRFG